MNTYSACVSCGKEINLHGRDFTYDVVSFCSEECKLFYYSKEQKPIRLRWTPDPKSEAASLLSYGPETLHSMGFTDAMIEGLKDMLV